MFVDYIKDILSNYRNNIPIEKLEEILKENFVNSNLNDIISHPDLFSSYNGIVFQKKAFIESKEIFFTEFEDYMKHKIPNLELGRSLIDHYKYYIPDILFIEWLNIALERKLLVFDLLLSLLIKPKKPKDKFKILTNRLIEFYCLICIYSLLLIQSNDKNYSKSLSFIKKIEDYETVIKSLFFNIFASPDIVKSSLDNWEKEFIETENKLKIIFDKSFSLVSSYSPRLLRRVIEKETKNFYPLVLLTRFDAKSFYEWIILLIEDNEITYRHNLFEDLGLR